MLKTTEKKEEIIEKSDSSITLNDPILKSAENEEEETHSLHLKGKYDNVIIRKKACHKSNDNEEKSLINKLPAILKYKGTTKDDR